MSTNGGFAVAMGADPARLPVGSVLLGAEPLAKDGWLEPNNAALVLPDKFTLFALSLVAALSAQKVHK